jgi:hypothetical protein
MAAPVRLETYTPILHCVVVHEPATASEEQGKKRNLTNHALTIAVYFSERNRVTKIVVFGAAESSGG